VPASDFKTTPVPAIYHKPVLRVGRSWWPRSRGVVKASDVGAR
jgi:hypothetical protein